MSEATTFVWDTVAMFLETDSLLQLVRDESDVRFSEAQATLVDARTSFLDTAKQTGHLRPGTSLEDIRRARNISIQRLETVQSVNPDDALAPFDDGRVCKITFSLHHAPHYVHRLPNGYFIAMTSYVENDNPPFGVEEATVRENILDDSTQINWLEQSNSPFASTGEQS